MGPHIINSMTGTLLHGLGTHSGFYPTLLRPCDCSHEASTLDSHLRPTQPFSDF